MAQGLRRLKVLFVTPWYPNRQKPIDGAFVREHAKAVQLFNDIVVLHAAGLAPDLQGRYRLEEATDAELCEGIRTFHLWDRRVRGLPAAYPLRVHAIVQASRRLADHGFRPDIVHAHIFAMGLPAALVARAYHCPMVISEHASLFARKMATPFDRLLARLAYRLAAYVLPVSRALQSTIEAEGMRARFQIVPNAIDTEFFRPAGQRLSGAGAGAGADGEATRLLFIGSLDSTDNKGLSYLLAALAQLQQRRTDWHLDVIGGGPAHEAYRELAASLRLGARVKFHGVQLRPAVVQALQTCDFLVSASLHETFGVVLIEALACGKPVIATASGGPSEIVTERIGLLVATQSAEQLCAAVEHMLDHHTDYAPEELSAYVRERYSHQAVGHLLDHMYRSAIGQRR